MIGAYAKAHLNEIFFVNDFGKISPKIITINKVITDPTTEPVVGFNPLILNKR